VSQKLPPVRKQKAPQGKVKALKHGRLPCFIRLQDIPSQGSREKSDVSIERMLFFAIALKSEANTRAGEEFLK